MEMRQNLRFVPRTVSFLSMLAVAGACAHQAAPVSSAIEQAPIDSALSVASFDTVWRLVRDTHYDKNLKGLDWNAIGAELRPKVVQARTVGEVRGALTELLSRLGDSHYAIIPSEALALPDSAGRGSGHEYGDLGIEVRLLDGAIVVSRVDPKGSAAKAGVRTGWVVEQVDSYVAAPVARGVARTSGSVERRVAGIHAALAVSRRLGGESGSPVHLTLRDERNHQHRLVIPRQDVTGDVVRLGNLPPILARLETARFHDPDGCIGVIRFTSWMPVIAAQFERAVREFRECRGIILDLRGNLGGVAAMVMGTSGWFLSRPDTLGILRMRDAELSYVAIPQHASGDGQPAEPYAGSLALLVDAHSASTSEIFAAGLQDAERARVFGDTTAGQALPATMYRLPNHDVLMYAVANFVTKKGTRLDGRGVVPDEVIPLRRADLLAGRDLALQGALRWVRSDRTRASTP
jgi:carboxyl-terminal processing protease